MIIGRFRPWLYRASTVFCWLPVIAIFAVGLQRRTVGPLWRTAVSIKRLILILLLKTASLSVFDLAALRTARGAA